MEEGVSKICSIAGSDSCGGAGIQVDIKTATSLCCHCCTVITVITAQNTVEVKSIVALDEILIREQLECVFSDIEIDVVKLGVLYSKKIVLLVCNYIKEINEKRKKRNKKELLVVFDPVFVAGSGAILIENKDYAKFVLDMICPITTIITPNFYECKFILQTLQCDIKTEQLNSVKLGKLLVDALNVNACLLKSCNIAETDITTTTTEQENKEFAVDHLCMRKKRTNKEKNGNENEAKNGAEHDVNNSDVSTNDIYLYDVYKLKTKREPGADIHGTGCSLATSIACFLAKKYDLLQACVKAKKYIYSCIKNGYNLGHRSKGLHHLKASQEMENTEYQVDITKITFDIL